MCIAIGKANKKKIYNCIFEGENYDNSALYRKIVNTPGMNVKNDDFLSNYSHELNIFL